MAPSRRRPYTPRMSDDPKDREAAVEAVRVRLEEATKNDPRVRFRIMVAAHVLLIVDRQIGKGEAGVDAEWARLRELVKDHPGAPELVSSLKTAVDACDASVEEKLREAPGEDEAAMRKAILTFIKAALLEKLQVGMPPSVQGAAPAPAPDGEPGPSGPGTPEVH